MAYNKKETNVPILNETLNASNDELIKYPCPINRKIVDVNYCFDCIMGQSCDIYSTMLDE